MTLKNGYFGEPVLKEPIYVKTRIKKGLLSLNLYKKRIFIEGNSFISLELIESYGNFPEEEKIYCKLHFSSGPIISPFVNTNARLCSPISKSWF